MYFFFVFVKYIFSTTPETADVSSLQTDDQNKTLSEGNLWSTDSGCESGKPDALQETLEDEANKACEIYKIDNEALVDVLVRKVIEVSCLEVKEDIATEVHVGICGGVKSSVDANYENIDFYREAKSVALEHTDSLAKSIEEAIDGLTYKDFTDAYIEKYVKKLRENTVGQDKNESKIKLSFDISDDFLQSKDLIKQVRKGFTDSGLDKVKESAYQVLENGAKDDIVCGVVGQYADRYSSAIMRSVAGKQKKLLPQALRDNIGARIQHLKSKNQDNETYKRPLDSLSSLDSPDESLPLKKPRREDSVSSDDSQSDESTTNSNETEHSGNSESS